MNEKITVSLTWEEWVRIMLGMDALQDVLEEEADKTPYPSERVRIRKLNDADREIKSKIYWTLDRYNPDKATENHAMIIRALHKMAESLEEEKSPKAAKYRDLAHKIEDELYPMNLPEWMKP